MINITNIFKAKDSQQTLETFLGKIYIHEDCSLHYARRIDKSTFKDFLGKKTIPALITVRCDVDEPILVTRSYFNVEQVKQLQQLTDESYSEIISSVVRQAHPFDNELIRTLEQGYLNMASKIEQNERAEHRKIELSSNYKKPN